MRRKKLANKKNLSDDGRKCLFRFFTIICTLPMNQLWDIHRNLNLCVLSGPFPIKTIFTSN